MEEQEKAHEHEHHETEHEKSHEHEEKKEELHEKAHEHHEHHEQKEEEKHHEPEKREKAEQKKEGASAPSGQHPPSSESRDLRDSRISILVFTLAGAAVGLLSSVLKSSGISSWITGAIGIVLLIVLALGMTKMFGRKIKFFYASLFVYLLIWLIIWIFLYNM
jgi:cation transport ATPase